MALRKAVSFRVAFLMFSFDCLDSCSGTSAVYRVILSCLQLIVSEMQVSNLDKICRKGHMCRVVSSQSSLGRIVRAVGR